MPFKIFEPQSVPEEVVNNDIALTRGKEMLGEVPGQQAPQKGATFPIMSLSDISGYEEPSSSDVLRHGVRTAARVGETLAGLPADLVQLAGTLVNMGTRALTRQESPFLREIPYIPNT